MNSKYFTAWWLQVAAAFTTTACAQLSPDDALKAFQHKPDVRVELVAAEPLVMSPCAMAFDERGRLFVAENRGYPSTANPPQGDIALLEDTDGDGRMDKRAVFADGLTFPNGVMPWRGGVIVTCAPDVLFLKDTDGDGKADERKVLLTGFATSGSTQLRVNCPTLGPDGWIYFAAGLSGGDITSPEHPERPAVKMTADLRWNPQTGEIENTDGRSQYGMSFDDFGRRFICMNRVPVQHVVLSSKVLARNPHLAFSETVQDCNERTVKTGLRGGGDGVRLFPISSNITTADSHAGSFSAACAITIWRGGALPDKYRGCAFTCDPTGNLVHADRLEPRGATFAAVPMFEQEQREFLASRDDWHRPVFLTSGPDGALYVCDMYRKTIEHPDYLPEEIRKRTDFESGKEMGRIWRISTSSPREQRATRTYNVETPQLFIEELESDVAWRRETAFRHIIESKEAALVPILRECLNSGHRAEAAAVAIRALFYLKQLTIPDCETALSEPDDLQYARSGVIPPIKEIAEASPRDLIKATALDMISRDPNLARALAYLPPTQMDNFDPRPSDETARRGALSVGWRHRMGQSENAILRLRWIVVFANQTFGNAYLWSALIRDSSDRWLRAAILAHMTTDMANNELSSFASENSSRWEARPRPTPDLIFEVAKLAGQEAHSYSNLSEHMITGLRRYGFDAAAAYVIGISSRSDTPFFSSDETMLAAEGVNARAIRDLLREAVGLLRSRNTSVDARVRCAQLLGRAPPLMAVESLSSAIRDGNPPVVRDAAFEAFLKLPLRAKEKIIAEPELWQNATPALRERMLSRLLASRSSSAALGLIESHVLPVSTMTATARQALLKHNDPAIRERAEKLFGKAVTGDRTKAFEDAKSALALTPNAEHGREVFKTLCASCHRLNREGYNVGPDLLDMRNQPKESILFHIAVPEAEVAPAFAPYLVETKDGRTLSGILASETATSLTLRMPLGVEETILRTNVARLEASPGSLMPAGLEAAMSRQDLADLLGFLKGER